MWEGQLYQKVEAFLLHGLDCRMDRIINEDASHDLDTGIPNAASHFV